MKLTRVVVSGFRGFAGAEVFDLNASAIIVVGVNGQGKTSLFDSILWALTGRVPRLGEGAHVVSMYSSSGEARVELDLQADDGDTIRVVRSTDDVQARLSIERNGLIETDESASVELLRALWPDAQHTSDGHAALTAALTRSVYLQQDLVREFIEADDDQQRFTAVAELVGAGRVTELSVALERAKVAWSRATNTQRTELEQVQSRLASYEGQLARLSSAVPVDDLAQSWDEWWRDVAGLTGSNVQAPELLAPEAPRRLDTAVKEIDAHERMVERRIDSLERFGRELEQADPRRVPADTDSLREAVKHAETEVENARGKLEAEQGRAAEQRRLQVERREKEAELRSLAELALRHLDGDCPVCGQKHDVSDTRRRMSELVGSEPVVPDQEPEELGAAAEALAQAEAARDRVQAALREAEVQELDDAQRRAQRDRHIAELELSSDSQVDLANVVERSLADAKKRLDGLVSRRAEGERFALALARAGERARRGEVERQVEGLKAEVAKLEGAVHARDETGQVAGVMLEQLRTAASDVVSARLDQIEPLLARIYATADPHPSFRVVKLLTTIVRGRGRLNTEVRDPSALVASESPATVLSSSQMNALAVSIFLALNLGVPSLPIQTVMLDDPLQSLDDVNLLGLVDLLRRTRDQRQLIVSTHDARFGRLLARKLRPIQESQRTRIIELNGWGPSGPAVRQDDAARESSHLRIVA